MHIISWRASSTMTLTFVCPRNGNNCYLKCEGRTILGNITEGALGSYTGSGVRDKGHAYCMWILTIYPDLNTIEVLNVIPTIVFTMESDITTKCTKVGKVYNA